MRNLTQAEQKEVSGKLESLGLFEFLLFASTSDGSRIVLVNRVEDITSFIGKLLIS